MMIIWRGFGIVVPIVLLISGWITSYWFEDTTLGNAIFMGWTLLWAGIVLILAGAAALSTSSEGEADENGDVQVSKNDFFWLPIWLWSVAFMGLGIYFIFTAEPEITDEYSVTDTEINTFATTEEVEVLEDRRLNFYNCSGDSIQIEIVNPTDAVLFDFYVDKRDYSFASVTPDNYTVNMDGSPYEIELGAITNEAYSEAWMILCGGVDFVLVDVTNICKADMSEKDVTAVDWMNNVVKRYSGDDLIEPEVASDNNGEIKIVAPNVYIPQELGNNQSVYVLIPVETDVEVTDELLDEEMVYLSVR